MTAEHTQTPVQQALTRKFQEEMQSGERIRWWAFPDPGHRAKRAQTRAFASSYLWLRLLILAGFLLVLVLNTRTLLSLEVFFGVGMLLVVLLIVGLSLWRKRAARLRLYRTLYAITTHRLIILTLDHDQAVQNSYTPQDLGRIDVIERSDGWGDLVIGRERVQSSGFSVAVVSPRLCGVDKVREVAQILTALKMGESSLPPQ